MSREEKVDVVVASISFGLLALGAGRAWGAAGWDIGLWVVPAVLAGPLVANALTEVVDEVGYWFCKRALAKLREAHEAEAEPPG